MIDFRKSIIAIVIAVLFTIFVHSTIDVFVPAYDYEKCSDLMPVYNEAEPVKDNTAYRECMDALEQEGMHYEFVAFMIASILGIIVTIVAMYLPVSTAVGMAIASGLLLGGLFTLFTGTLRGWDGLHEIARPIVLLIEMVIVIWVAYRKLNDAKPQKGKKK